LAEAMIFIFIVSYLYLDAVQKEKSLFRYF